jgi:hypothetical protein
MKYAKIYVVNRDNNLRELLLSTRHYNVWLHVEDHAPSGEVCVTLSSQHKNEIIDFLEDYGYYEGLDDEEIKKFNETIS